MSDLDNQINDQLDNDKTADGVVPIVENDQQPPQDAVQSEELEVVFEDDKEGDQKQKPENDDEAKRRAAFAKAKGKEREAKDRAKAEKQRADKLEAELDDLKSNVNSIKRGPRPDPFDYTDQDEFYADLDKWTGLSNEPEKKAAEAPVVPAYEPDIEAEFRLDDGSKKLKSAGISDFDSRLESFKGMVSKVSTAPDVLINSLSKIAVDAGIDPAKALYMVERNPSSFDEILEVATSDIKIAKILEREAAKLKLRKKGSIDSAPEPNVRQGAVKKSDALSQYGNFE